MVTQGRRVYNNDDGTFPKLLPGDYIHEDKSGHWLAVCPSDERLLGDLSLHTVTEHEDGTITVSPSILLEGWGGEGVLWHGFLERGVWREC